MLTNPKWIITPSGYSPADDQTKFVPASDPIGAAVAAGVAGDQFQCVPGNFPRCKGISKPSVSICGWDRTLGITQIMRDDTVGSTDTIFLDPPAPYIYLQDLNILADDRAGIKTAAPAGVMKNGPIALYGCHIFGIGSPHDPNWSDKCWWGGHHYLTTGYTELNVWTWSIYEQHVRYFHNIQGNHAFFGGGGAMAGGCDLFFVARQKEGRDLPVGKGNILIDGRYTEDCCVGQGGSALSFRGGMPTSTITLNNGKVRLGCKSSLAAPFNQNICGAIEVDSAGESSPGAGDAAHPGGTKAVELFRYDIEVGTVYPGRGGMIRPVVDIAACGRFHMDSTRIHVTRAAGQYPIALSLKSTVSEIQITGQNDVVGWVEWHPDGPDAARYHSWAEFQAAQPQVFG